MNQALTVHAEPVPRINYDEGQLALIKSIFCKGATDDEFHLFVHVSKHTGLDIMSKQLHAVKRWDSKLQREVMAIQTSVDGFRLIAQRSGAYRGQSAPEWCGDDMAWHPVWLSDTPPSAARIAVHREGFAEPCWGVARWKSYAQTGKNGLAPMWGKMPDVMLAKCAECLALRKAFPQELSGLYADEEMPPPDAPKPEKTNSKGEPAQKKTEWPPAQDLERGKIRAELIEIGGEAADKEFLTLNRTMAYDPISDAIDAMNVLLRKWQDIEDQAKQGEKS